MRRIYVASGLFSNPETATVSLRGGPLVGDLLVNDNGVPGKFIKTLDGRLRIEYADEMGEQRKLAQLYPEIR